ncbi:hypothetical protein Aab01nite_60170 [Paractinoplanes abujensis]|uniref:Uncharacterized protein n=1 Tax=Paractinoplanes abujensis TaxID=882441 RepID=A0A7W7CXF5_9ACTN|nr:hypothetical protein [Actinoplanes abujensis]MBB4696432.1 hypothetical protein [Actinoplanes abujensis]GID22427.1 hypothetical protein Aab01nite_60170 [Actinoplanes abujensis]
MDDRELVAYLRRCTEADNHRYADVAGRFGGEALLDSHLPMLDLIDQPAKDWQAMDLADERYVGLTHALRVIVRAYRAPRVMKTYVPVPSRR